MHHLRSPAARLLLAVAVLVPLLAVPASATDALRVATFNVKGVDFGTSSFDALVDILERVDPDVVVLQEVASPESGAVLSLALITGYADFAVSEINGTLSGSFRNAVLSKYPITSETSWHSENISGDFSANDMTRDILEVRLDVPDASGPVIVFGLHFKAGSGNDDYFRRAVEIQRLEKVVEDAMTTTPDAIVFIAGDLNQNIDEGPFGQVYNSLPSGLPGSYELGNDISFPVVYDPFVDIASFGTGFVLTEPTFEDSTNLDNTFITGGRLDYIWAEPETELIGDEVYSSLWDDDLDAFPQGNYLYKKGTSLTGSVSSTASDHYLVFADYLLEGADGERIGNGTAGTHGIVPRAGISGSPIAGTGPFAARLLYAPPSTVATLLLGFAQFVPPLEVDAFSATLAPGGKVYVAWTLLISNLPTDADGEISLNFGNIPGSALGLTVDLQWYVVDDNPFIFGDGTMSDAYEFTIQ